MTAPLPLGLSFVNMECKHCGAPGQLPSQDGKIALKLCWSCETGLRVEGTDWRRR